MACYPSIHNYVEKGNRRRKPEIERLKKVI